MKQTVLYLLLLVAVASSQPVDNLVETPGSIPSDNPAVKAIEADINKVTDMEASESGFKKCLKFGGCGGFGPGFGAPFAPFPHAPIAPIGFGSPAFGPVGLGFAAAPLAPVGLGFGAPVVPGAFGPVAPIGGGFGFPPVAPIGFAPVFGGFF